MKIIETEKTLKLKEKMKDKSLSSSERQGILEEIYRERYKADPRKPITQRSYTKRSMVAALLMLAAGLSFFIAEGMGVFGSRYEDVISFVVFIVFASVFAVTTVPAFRCKLEPDDESSKANKLKANSVAMGILAILVMLVCFVFDSYLPEEIVINKKAITFGAFTVGGLYYFLYCLFFLKFDGFKDEDEGDDE